MGVEDAADRSEVKQLSLFGALNGAAQMVGRDDGGEIKQRSRHRGCRDASLLCDLD